MTLSWIEISKSAILSNIAAIKKNLKPKVKFIGVVKANAYGHGLFEVVSTIKDKVDYLAVYDFNDAVFLRSKKITKPIFVMGFTPLDKINLSVKNKLEISVSNFEILQEAKKLPKNKQIKIHICIDSGLGRDGFLKSDLKKLLPLLKNNNLEVVGLYTHLAASDDDSFLSYTKKQIAELLWWKKELAKIGISPMVHGSSTTGSLISEFKNCFDAVRIGGGLYGLWSSKEAAQKNFHKTRLKSALSWKTKIIEVKEMPKGSHISYSCTFTLKRDSRIAILPIGYFDGIPRSSSNKSQVLINGKKVPQIGRVTMNMIVIDVTDLKKVKIGDLVTVIGKDKKEEITSQDWGDWSDSFNYEITTRLSQSTTRILSK
jgi:alanine racemase